MDNKDLRPEDGFIELAQERPRVDVILNNGEYLYGKWVSELDWGAYSAITHWRPRWPKNNDQSFREAVIRECIAALPGRLSHTGRVKAVGYNEALSDVRNRLEALLPTPEPAEDPLLIEAREIVAKVYEKANFLKISIQSVRAGDEDDRVSVQSAYAALKSREARA